MTAQIYEILTAMGMGLLVGVGMTWYWLRSKIEENVTADLQAKNEENERMAKARHERIEQIRIEALTERDQAKRTARQQIEQAQKTVAEAQARIDKAERGLNAERERRREAQNAYRRKKEQYQWLKQNA